MSFAALRSPTWRRTPPWRESVEGGYQRPDPALWTPQLLPGLRALYDAELGQPKHGGAGAYVQLDGASGDYIYTPDSANIRITNSFEVMMRVYCNDWTNGANQTLCGRYVTSTNLRSFRVFADSLGRISVAVSSDGTGATIATSLITPTVPLPDATWIWMKVTFLGDDGAGNRVASLFTAADTGSNDVLPSSWTANGVDTDAGTASAHFAAATAPFEIGSFNNGALERFSGRFGRVILRDGIDGPIAADFNASKCYGPGYTEGLPVAADGSKYLQLYGRNSDYIYTADKAALQATPTGVIQLTGKVRFDSALPATDVYVVIKGSSYATREYSLVVRSTGRISFFSRNAATAAVDVTSSVAAPLVAGSWLWVRAAADPVAGTVTFATSSDGLAWTQLGGLGAPGAWTPITSTANLHLGLTGPVAIQRATVEIGGATVADYNAQLAGPHGSGDAYGNTWIHNNPKRTEWTLGLPKIYDRSGNNVAPATFGSGSNQPAWLTMEEGPAVHMRQAAGGNTVTAVTGAFAAGQQTGVLDAWSDNWNQSATVRYLSVRSGAYSMTLMNVGGGTLRLYGSGAFIISSGHPASGRVQWRIRRTDTTSAEIAWRTDGVIDPDAAGWIVSGSGALADGANASVSTVIGDDTGTSNLVAYRARGYDPNGLVWSFDAAACGQSGYTSPEGKPWVVNRTSTGRKTVVQSPTAASDRSVILLGTDDYMIVPAAAVSFPANQNDPLTVGVVSRQWATTVSAPRLFDSRSAGLASGIVIRHPTATSFDGIGYDAGGGGAFTVPAIGFTYGLRNVLTLAKDGVSALLRLNGVNGTTNAPLAADATSASDANIGRQVNGVLYWDGEFQALWLRTVKESDAEHGLNTAYYRGGL